MSTATYTEIQAALQTALLSLSVCATGLTTLSATATGYARTAGSFLTDGFTPGMEVTPAGFTANPVDVITGVTALTVTTRNAHARQTAGSGRSLTVGLPSSRAAENTDFKPVQGVPWVEEQFIPGPAFVVNDGDVGAREMRATYRPRVYVPANTGILADGRYADAIVALFAPGTQFTLASGHKLIVRADALPTPGPRSNAAPGWSYIPVTVAVRVDNVT